MLETSDLQAGSEGCGAAGLLEPWHAVVSCRPPSSAEVARWREKRGEFKKKITEVEQFKQTKAAPGKTE